MSAQANIVAFDGAGVPVSHTLVGIGTGVENDSVIFADWGERLASVPLDAQVRARMDRRTLKSGVQQVSLTVSVPVMESVSGQNAAGYTAPPKVAYVDTIKVTGYFSSRSTIAGRRLVRQLAANILNGLATTQTVTTTGPAAELFDQAVVPT